MRHITLKKTFTRAAAVVATLLMTMAATAAFAQSAPAAPAKVTGVWCQYTAGDANIIKQGCFETAEACKTASGCTSDTCGAGHSCTCFASDKCPGPAATGKSMLKDPLGNAGIRIVVGRATNIFIGLSGTFALLMFVIGGMKMIMSQGDSKKYAEGLNSVKWASIGLAVVFGSYAVLNAIFGALGSIAS